MKIGLQCELSDTVSRHLFRTIARRVQSNGWELARDFRFGFPWERNACGEIDVLVTRVGSEAEQARCASFAEVPVINFSNGHRTPDFFQVMHDNVAIGRLAALHLWEQGYRRPGVLGFTHGFFSSERLRGFVESWPGQPVAHFPLLDGPPSPPEFARQLLKMADVDAVYAVNDLLAAHVVLAARSLGWRIPERLAVMGTDHDDIMGIWAGRELTSVQFDYDDLADAIVAQMERICRDRSARPTLVTVPPREVYPGDTTGRARPDCPRLAAAFEILAGASFADVNVDALANAVRMSRRTFERFFLEEVGVSPGSALLRARIDLAKRLLSERSATIDLIAEYCGYADRTKFSTRFKAETGYSPAAYRHRFQRRIL